MTKKKKRINYWHGDTLMSFLLGFTKESPLTVIAKNLPKVPMPERPQYFIDKENEERISECCDAEIQGGFCVNCKGRAQ